MTVAEIYQIYGAIQQGGRIFIGGLDPNKFATAQGFNQYFRKNFDPNEIEVIPLANISNYTAVLNSNGFLNVSLYVSEFFDIPSRVFSNFGTPKSGSQIKYYIDPEGYSKSLSIRSFASQTGMSHFLVKGLNSLGLQWNTSVNIDYLDFESLYLLGEFYFDNMRFGVERLNVRNASMLGASQDPASDTVFVNFNLEQSNKRNVIYAHPVMATINNGSVLYTLQQAINNGVDVRFVNDTSNIPATVTDLSAEIIGANFVKLDFTNIVDADFYEVWIKDFSDPENVVNQFFLFSEVSNTNKYVAELKENTQYEIRVKAVDANYNKGEFSENIILTTANQNDVSITETNIGGTYADFVIDNFAVLSEAYNISNIEIYLDNVLNRTISAQDNFLIYGLNELTNYDVKIKLITPKSSLESDTTTTTTINIPALFQKAVAYYKLDETSGNAIDVVNGYNGTLNGTINRNGEWYDYGTNEGYVNIPDNDDFSFGNSDFVIRTTVIFDGFNSQNRAWLVSKREENNNLKNEWQLIWFDSLGLSFFIWDDSNNSYNVDYPTFQPTIGQKYILGVTLNGTTLDLFLDGQIVATIQIPSGTTFANSTSPVKLGNETFLTNLNLVGKQKETVIIKGSGWNAQDISENYNNGNGTTI